VLEGLLADVGGEDDLALEAVEALAALYLLAEGVDLFVVDHHRVLVGLSVFAHLRVYYSDKQQEQS
jgi:hypothetical protein